ncbi:MAG: FecCD family ABC transporter permease [Candidatus Nezhaarchaeales archaeon]
MKKREAREVLSEYKGLTTKRKTFLLILVLLIIAVIFLRTLKGGPLASFEDSLKAFMSYFGFNVGQVSELAKTAVWSIRLPRSLFAFMAGCALGVAGAIMQVVVRNPLASPYTLGISAAAGFGAALAIVLGVGVMTTSGSLIIIVNAFIFAMIATIIVLGISALRGATPESMILAGIAMLYLFSSLTSLLEYLSETYALRDVVFWLLGDLGRYTWEKIGIWFMILLISMPIIMAKLWDYNLLMAGDDVAKGLGVNVKVLRLSSMALASFITAAVICFTGVIGFVGLVGPHMVRMIIGADNRYVIPASALAGGLLLEVADILAFEVMPPTVLPIGIITSLMGVPLFLYLLLRRGRREVW